MAQVVIYNQNNTQTIYIVGLTDSTGAYVSGATLSGTLVQDGNTIATLTFSPTLVAGNYSAPLVGFNAPVGNAILNITGTNAGATINFSTIVAILNRTI
jgi:hypothetical protein